jgi:hypothetical protein
MMKLAVTPLDADLVPAIGFQHSDEVFDFHVASPIAMSAVAA